MLSGRQIREACNLLDWEIVTLSSKAKISLDVALRAKHHDGTPSITLAQSAKIRAVFEAEGIRFGGNGAVLMVARAAH